MTTPEPLGDYDPTGYEADLDEQIAKVHESRHADKRQKWMLFAGLLVALLSLAISGWLLLQSMAEAERERATTATVQEQKKEIAEEAQKALCGTEEREIYDRDLCAKWTELAKAPAKIEVLDVSREDIVDAFRAYCEEGNCRGANGRSPTPEDVATAFARFCADGNCRGADGKDGAAAPPMEPPVDGKDGRDGIDGQNGQDAPAPTPEMMLAAVTTYCADGRCIGQAGANGADGPPPTPEAIAAAVEAFCADGKCVGAKGDKGDKGDPGADSTVPGPASTVPGPAGRGIQSIQCQQEPEYAWIVTYTDGTSESVPGPCRVADQPGPPITPPGQVTP